MNWKKWLLIGIIINVIGSVLLPYLVFFGFFGGWLNFNQYSLLGLVSTIINNVILSWIIVITLSLLYGSIQESNKKNTKIKKIIMIALILEIIIFGFMWINSEDYQTWETLEDCSGLKNIESRDSCYFSFAIEDNDPNLCSRLSGNDPYDLIPDCLAVVNQDIEYCNEHRTQIEKDSCFEHMSIVLLDKNICNNVLSPDRKSSCFDAFNQFVIVNNIDLPNS